MWPFGKPHRHCLELVAETYAPPLKNADDVFLEDEEVLERAVHGCTTFLWKCADMTCSYTKTVVMLGKKIDGV